VTTSGQDVPDDPETGDDEPEDSRLPRLWQATDLVPATKPRWLARGRIPRGATTILVGEEGIGKSLLWVWITAAVTTGRALPGFGLPERSPEKVVIVITEDDWSFQVRPRLELAGADLSMIQVICTDQDGSGSPVFPIDIYLLNDTAAALVVVDAWLDTVPSSLNVRDPQHARQALHPWKDVATRTGAAIMLLTHTNRVASSSPRDKYAATIELRKKARMTLYAQQDEDGLLVVGPEKSNMTGLIAASQFRVAASQVFEADDDGDGTVPYLEYVGESTMTARDLVSEKHETQHGTEHGSKDEAAEWLQAFLAEGEREAEAVIKAADKVGISKRTLDRAKKRAGAASRKSAFSGGWVWVLAPKDATKNAKIANETDAPQLGNLGDLGGDLRNLGICQTCGDVMSLDDGTGTHPTCEAA
jgi:hypothetical protein